MVVAAAADIVAAAADIAAAEAVGVHCLNVKTWNYQSSTNWARRATWAIWAAFASNLRRCHFHSDDYCNHGLEDTVAEADGGAAEALEVGGLT